MKFWDTRTATPAAVVNLSERAYSMDTKGAMMVVATADRKVSVHVYFIKNISRTSAVSSTNFGSILIFASCVVGTCYSGVYTIWVVFLRVETVATLPLVCVQQCS